MKYYNKVKYFFKKPPIHFHIGKYRYHMFLDPIKMSLFYFQNSKLGWKDKMGSPRFETPPCILLKIFGIEFRILWSWNGRNDKADNDAIFWETILDITEYGKTLDNAINDNTWTSLPKNSNGKKEFYNVKTLNMLKNYN